MKLFWKVCRILLKTAAVLVVLAILGFWAIRYSVWKENIQTYYSEIELDDGPYVFWENDFTIRIVNMQFQETTDEPNGFFDTFKAAWKQELPASYTSSEVTIDLRDSTTARERLIQEIGVALIPGKKASIPASEFRADRIAAVGDVHGNYNHLEEVLRNASIVDSDRNWSWGDGHLVFVGDVFDKGPRVTESLWLIYKLEQQALTAGGMVHFLLGNHEMMVLRGMSPDYERGRKYSNIARELGERYSSWFEANSELGRWLRTKNTVVKINNRLFVHGGLSEDVVDRGLSIEELNDYGRRLLDLETIDDTSPEERDDLALLESFWGPYEYRGYVGFRGAVGAVVSKVSDKTDDLSLNVRSAEIMEKVLQFYGCDQVVVGHAQVGSISQFRDDTIVAINIRLPVTDIIAEDSNAQILLIEGDNLYRQRIDGVMERL